MRNMDAVSMDAMLARFSERLEAEDIAQLNDYDIRI